MNMLAGVDGIAVHVTRIFEETVGISSVGFSDGKLVGTGERHAVYRAEVSGLGIVEITEEVYQRLYAQFQQRDQAANTKMAPGHEQAPISGVTRYASAPRTRPSPIAEMWRAGEDTAEPVAEEADPAFSFDDVVSSSEEPVEPEPTTDEIREVAKAELKELYRDLAQAGVPGEELKVMHLNPERLMDYGFEPDVPVFFARLVQLAFGEPPPQPEPQPEEEADDIPTEQLAHQLLDLSAAVSQKKTPPALFVEEKPRVIRPDPTAQRRSAVTAMLEKVRPQNAEADRIKSMRAKAAKLPPRRVPMDDMGNPMVQFSPTPPPPPRMKGSDEDGFTQG